MILSAAKIVLLGCNAVNLWTTYPQQQLHINRIYGGIFFCTDLAVGINICYNSPCLCLFRLLLWLVGSLRWEG